MQRHYIYRIEEKVTGEFYWGVRTCNCDPKDDPYMGSMKTWKPNKNNLIKTNIIEYNSRPSADKAEVIVIDYYSDKDKFPLNRNYHNGLSFKSKGKPITNEIREKYRHAALNRSKEHTEKLLLAAKNRTYYPPLSEEHINILRRVNSNRIVTTETRLKLSIALKGKNKEKPSIETIMKRIESRKNNGKPWLSRETKQKIATAQKGKIISAETRTKISIAGKGKHKPKRTEEHQRKLTLSQIGSKRSEEAKQHMREARLKYLEEKRKNIPLS